MPEPMRATLRVDMEDLQNGEEITVWRRRHGQHPPWEDRSRRVLWALGFVSELADAPQHTERHHHHHRHPHQEGPIDMSFSLKDNQEVSFAVAGADSRGNPATLTGTPVYSVDNPGLLALTDNGDGSGSVAAVGPTGSATLTVSDSETNGKQFIGSIAFDIVAGDVASVAISVGQPTDQEPAAAGGGGDVTPPVVEPPADNTGGDVTPPADNAGGDVTPPADVTPPDPDAPQVNA